PRYVRGTEPEGLITQYSLAKRYGVYLSLVRTEAILETRRDYDNGAAFFFEDDLVNMESALAAAVSTIVEARDRWRVLHGQSEPTVDDLIQVLQDPALAATRFIIVGVRDRWCALHDKPEPTVDDLIQFLQESVER